MSKPSVTLIWHEAGNQLYHDRFRALAEEVDLDVMGPTEFQGMHFNGEGRGFSLRLFKAFATFHWLTYFSPAMIYAGARLKKDVLYVHEEPHSITAFLCALVKGSRKMIIESSAINMKGNFGGWNFLEAFVYRRAYRIVPKNDEVRQTLHDRGAPLAKLTAPVGNGVALQSFSPVEKSEARRRLAEKFPQCADVFSGGKFILGFAGRIWRPKGIEIFKDIEGQNGIRVLLCGPCADDVLAQELIGAGICLLPRLGMEDLRLFYSALDLFMLPSRDTPGWREQFGRVCIEAIYCGTPAIGSRVGGIPMAIGKTSTFPPDDLSAALSLIIELKNTEVWSTRLAQQAKHVEMRFSWSSIASQVRQIAENGAYTLAEDKLGS